jgi:hypothetical protein
MNTHPSISSEDQSLLERYFAGEMDEQEAQAFRERAKREQALGEAFRQRQSELRAEAPASLEAGQEDGLDLSDPREALRERQMYRLVIAGVVLFLVLIPVYLFLRTSDLSSQTLYDSFFEAYPVKAGLYRKKEGAAKAGLQAYRMTNYELALGKLQEYLVQNPQDYPLQLYAGIAMMQEERYSQAMQTLGTVAENAGSPWAEEARWYLALIHMQQENREQALRRLRAIAEADGKHSQEAKSLLENY